MLKRNCISLDDLNEKFFDSKNDFKLIISKSTQYIKTIFDLIVSLFILVLTLPIWLVTVLLMKIESPGPVFYMQQRVGLNNKEFSVIKFRSMRIDAEKQGAQWAQANDPRVTKVGKFIRKTRIDELPQLINVLKGDMSLIGPRPERKVFIEQLELAIPHYNFRHKVKPGITGLAQVSYPYGASVEDAERKHEYDMFYIKHYSFKLDILIVICTIKTILFGMGR